MALTIRTDQMLALERMRFVQRAHSLANSAQASYPGPPHTAMLLRLLDRAFTLGFREPHHASVLAGMALRWGEDFDENLPWAKEVLSATRVPADLRISELLERSNAAILDKYLDNEPEPEEPDDPE